MRTKEQFVQAIIDDYVKGVENAYEGYINAGYEVVKGESDIDFIKRCAEQDYEDADWGGCIYEDYL